MSDFAKFLITRGWRFGQRESEEDLKTLFYRAVFLCVRGPNGTGLSVDEAFYQLGIVDPATRYRFREAIEHIINDPGERQLIYLADLTIINEFLKSRHGCMSSLAMVKAGGGKLC